MDGRRSKHSTQALYQYRLVLDLFLAVFTSPYPSNHQRSRPRRPQIDFSSPGSLSPPSQMHSAFSRRSFVAGVAASPLVKPSINQAPRSAAAMPKRLDAHGACFSAAAAAACCLLSEARCLSVASAAVQCVSFIQPTCSLYQSPFQHQPASNPSSVHVWAPADQQERFPYAGALIGAASASPEPPMPGYAELLLSEMAAAGVDGALIVQVRWGRGGDGLESC